MIKAEIIYIFYQVKQMNNRSIKKMEFLKRKIGLLLGFKKKKKDNYSKK